MAVNYLNKQYRIEFEGGDLTVRGLKFPEISQLVDAHRETAERLFGRFSGRDPDVITQDDAATVAMEVLLAAPVFIAHVISLAADAADQYELVASLPVDVQVAAIEQIAIMTFAMAGGPKNLIEMVLRMATGTSHLVGNLRQSRI